MPARTWIRSCSRSALASMAFVLTAVHAGAQDGTATTRQTELSSITVVDALNLFPNVGALYLPC